MSSPVLAIMDVLPDSFRYLLDGFLGAAVHGRPVICASNEFARFSPPPGQRCQSYTADFIAKTGGHVQNGSGGLRILPIC